MFGTGIVISASIHVLLLGLLALGIFFKGDKPPPPFREVEFIDVTPVDGSSFPGEQPPADWQQSPYIYHQVPASWQDATGQYSPVTDDWQAQPHWPEDEIQPAPWQEEPVREQSWLPPEQPYAPGEPGSFNAPQPRLRHPRSGRRHDHEA